MAATIRVVILIGVLIASCVSAKIVIEACHLVVYYSILSIRNAMFNEIGTESKMFEYINLKKKVYHFFVFLQDFLTAIFVSSVLSY